MTARDDQRTDLASLIPQDPWRREAACAGHPEPLWDESVHGETRGEREARHHKAKAICATCPVAFSCGLDIDWTWDGGIRAGHLIPAVKTAARPTHQRTGRPLAPIDHGTDAGRRNHYRRGEKPCDECRDARKKVNA